MATLNVYTTSGKKTSTITAKKAIFETKINEPLMTQAVRVYLSNQRQASAQTKSRGEVVASKKKVWRQKGTGRARHGSRNAPIFVGGAKAHGPTGEQNFKLKMGKKMKQASLFSALTTKLKEKAIIIVDGFDKLEAKAKVFDKSLHSIVKDPKKLLLLLSESKDSIKRGTNNLTYVNTSLAKNLTTYHALNAKTLIFTKEGLKAFENHYLKK